MKTPTWMTVALTGAGGFLAGVLLVALLGGPKGTVRTTTVKRTDTVTRTVDGRATVPAVLGKRLPEARATLEAAGFDVDVDDDTLFGISNEDAFSVDDQDPSGGTRAAPGATVTIHVERD